MLKSFRKQIWLLQSLKLEALSYQLLIMHRAASCRESEIWDSTDVRLLLCLPNFSSGIKNSKMKQIKTFIFVRLSDCKILSHFLPFILLNAQAHASLHALSADLSRKESISPSRKQLMLAAVVPLECPGFQAQLDLLADVVNIFSLFNISLNLINLFLGSIFIFRAISPFPSSCLKILIFYLRCSR